MSSGRYDVFSMKKLIGLALLTVMLVIGLSYAPLQPSQGAEPSYSDRLYHSHQSDRPIASQAIAQSPSQAVTSETVSYGTVEGVPVNGYLSRPANAEGNLPGLIVIHEWWGLNDNIKAMTDRLAGEGYVALAVDLLGSVADNPDAARAQVQEAAQRPQQLEENIRQAYQYLMETEQAEAIASIGWCFGGSWSLRTALLFPDELDAAVIYYGGQIETDPARLEALNMPILGIFGELDDNPPVETVRQFEAALTSLGKDVEIHIYEGADHAFANPSGTRYNAIAAEDAWQRTIAFLQEHLF